MKLKKRGYILFAYYGGTIESFEFCNNRKELMRKYRNEWDDKWDMDDRHKIHYFYLDIFKSKYFPLPKFKNNYDQSKGYHQCELTVLSTKTF